MAARADVAQLARASPCHGEGRGFESLHPLSAKPPDFRGFRVFCRETQVAAVDMSSARVGSKPDLDSRDCASSEGPGGCPSRDLESRANSASILHRGDTILHRSVTTAWRATRVPHVAAPSGRGEDFERASDRQAAFSSSVVTPLPRTLGRGPAAPCHRRAVGAISRPESRCVSCACGARRCRGTRLRRRGAPRAAAAPRRTAPAARRCSRCAGLRATLGSRLRVRA